MQKGKFSLNISKIFFMERMAKHWNLLPRQVVVSSSLKVFKRHGYKGVWFSDRTHRSG